MTTQEERLQIVEFDLKHFKTETIKAYGEMAYEMVIIKGLTEDSIKRLSRLTETVEKRFERVDIRLDGMDAHLESMDTRLERLETTLSEHTAQFNRLEGMLAQILTRLPEKP
jgi:archaellum component FlaC